MIIIIVISNIINIVTVIIVIIILILIQAASKPVPYLRLSVRNNTGESLVVVPLRFSLEVGGIIKLAFADI